MRGLVITLALAVAALPAAALGDPASDVPRVAAPEPSRQVDLAAGVPAPFSGSLINRARALEIAQASPSVKCATDLAGCRASEKACLDSSGSTAGVALGTVVGVVVVVGISAVAVGVIVGALSYAKATK